MKISQKSLSTWVRYLDIEDHQKLNQQTKPTKLYERKRSSILTNTAHTESASCWDQQDSEDKEQEGGAEDDQAAI